MSKERGKFTCESRGFNGRPGCCTVIHGGRTGLAPAERGSGWGWVSLGRLLHPLQRKSHPGHSAGSPWEPCSAITHASGLHQCLL